VATAEALNHAGITDPYELYQHIHPSEVGTCLGSGMGGMHSLAQMFKERRDEKEVQSDIMQETWVLLFLHLTFLMQRWTVSSIPLLGGSIYY
jgi:fatty acid synthase subunit alpha, fungi type